MINLTDTERRKFSLWLQQDVESNRMILEQLKKLPHAKHIVDQKQRQIAACITVAKMIEDTESQSIVAPNQGPGGEGGNGGD